MDKATRSHLMSAMSRVKAAMAGLNTAQSTCTCCGVVKYDNLVENRTHQVLGGVVTKLERALDALEGG